MTLNAKMTMADLQRTVPLKMLHELDLHFFLFILAVYFYLWFLCKNELRISCLLDTLVKIMQREKQFSSQKNDDINHILDQIRARSMEYK